MEYELFSKRQQRIQGEIPDTYQYETIPDELRVQILYIWGKIWGTPVYNNFDELQVSLPAYDAYMSMLTTLCEEYGVLALDGGDHPNEDGYGFYWVVRDFLLKTEDINKVIDVIEVSFFGKQHFQNEIIWCYERGSRRKSQYGRKHDVILFYSKTKNYVFDSDAVRVERRKTHMKVETDLEGRTWQVKKDAKSGKVYRYSTDVGVLCPDWWIGIQQLNRNEKERLGYPTQKPLALLDRIIKASSNEGHVVFDPFCGTQPPVSGTGEHAEPVNDNRQTPSMNGNETHQTPSLTDNDSPKIVALLENQVADLKSQLAQASDRETALITEKSKLLDLTDRLQKQNEVLMLPPPAKKRSWLHRLTGR